MLFLTPLCLMHHDLLAGHPLHSCSPAWPGSNCWSTTRTLSRSEKLRGKMLWWCPITDVVRWQEKARAFCMPCISPYVQRWSKSRETSPSLLLFFVVQEVVLPSWF
ncbi:hypothetical protein DUNSADRAFT_3391 [Dunaliella salina]|uniref:Secreted protein n=1 Tax=Dunaliella salina TaxID=3046 RepID=A0ABQ7FVF4_DUNSA|nr:hypothetical protein DUNSADRAFT_3391 [Dunaliella salina]|eukprot:KAF5826364.1 hypothetical protein DUNSADRAFT_3391 [Dunaliella salina]